MSKNYYVYKCMYGAEVLYIGATTQSLSTSISDVKRKHSDIGKFQNMKVYGFDCKNRAFMNQIKIGAILFYQPTYNHTYNYADTLDILDINYDALNWMPYKDIKDVSKKTGTLSKKSQPNAIKRHNPVLNPNKPESLKNGWTLVCTKDILLTNDHMELLSFIYGNPSMGTNACAYEFYNLAAFHPLISKYGSGRYLLALLEDLSNIYALPPSNSTNCNMINKPLPLISYTAKAENPGKCMIIKANTMRCMQELIITLFQSEEFYIWHTGKKPFLEKSWISPQKYDAIWGFQFKNQLLRYEIDWMEPQRYDRAC